MIMTFDYEPKDKLRLEFETTSRLSVLQKSVSAIIFILVLS